MLWRGLFLQGNMNECRVKTHDVKVNELLSGFLSYVLEFLWELDLNKYEVNSIPFRFSLIRLDS